jgi:hypothetical protein
MRNQAVFVLLSIPCLAIVVESASGASSYIAQSESKPSIQTSHKEARLENLRYELLNAVMSGSSQRLTSKKSCENFVSNGQDTIGKFVSWSLSFYEADKDNRIETNCLNSDQSCTVEFFADSKGEGRWACGLRFKYDRKKHKIDSKSVECIGSC